MLYDVILPLAFEGVFTYNIPDLIDENHAVGTRVLVPLGKKKIRTGIILRRHDESVPSDYIVKDIIEVLDESPLVTQEQLLLWQWIASYYMCTIGEVMKAALPSAFRLESETHVCINPVFQASESLTANQQKILDFLSDGKEKTIDEICRSAGMRNILPALKKLHELEAVFVGEQVEEKYRPKQEPWISLSPSLQDRPSELQLVLDSLGRAPKQQQLLSFFLSLTDGGQAIRREELMALSAASPAALKTLIEKDILYQRLRQKERLVSQPATMEAKTLNDEQLSARQEIANLWEKHETVLLHGVTGSGKTEIYISLIQEMLNKGKQVLYLVPEIALTTQLTTRLEAVFGSALVVYHSRFSDQERVEIYRKVFADENGCVVLGVRSSLFLPFSRLGMIVVDEEHDGSYKQQDPAPRYNARAVAIMLANYFSAKVLLGTATPAIETYYNALTGKYGLVTLAHRHGEIELPKIKIIDTKRQYRRKEMQGHFSDQLVNKISDEIGKNKQVIVFQNRRGYASWIECRQCAYVPKCVNCDVSMTLHKRQDVLVCHYCGYTIPVPRVCPACGQATLADYVAGTEKIEDEAYELFPNAQISRMDFDTTRSKHSYQRIIDDFAAHRTDILIGTQMVSKGLHFDDVSMVAVLNADNLMNQPDFRSYERAYQMLEQVSGRAGRKHQQGEVIVQTANPENSLFGYVAAHDYRTFYEEQIQEREAFRYPPFYRLMVITIKHRDIKKADAVAQNLQGRLQNVFTRRCSRVTQPAISKMQNQYIRNILLKIENTAPYSIAKQLLQQQIQEVMQTAEGKSATIYVDVDP